MVYFQGKISYVVSLDNFHITLKKDADKLEDLRDKTKNVVSLGLGRFDPTTKGFGPRCLYKKPQVGW